MQSMILSSRRILLAAGLGLFALLTGGVWPTHAADRNSLEVASGNGVYSFSVELADNDNDRSRGLMFRKSLPEGQGMLFDFHQDRPVSMWMRNTYVSLDMFFIRSDGRILRIAEHTEPLSERIIDSGGPVRAVLEVVAGTAHKLGIKPGDRVAHPIFTH